MSNKDQLEVALAQISPVWLDREKTLEKIMDYVSMANKKACRLVAFGEALLPGYPFWIELTDGARFDSPLQKDLYAHYLDQAVQIEAGDLGRLTQLAAELDIAVVVGVIERAANRGGHSLYCSLVYIDAGRGIKAVHRKLMPTHEERLAWAPGDGHGLRVHSLGKFTVGGLNCWENWMPLARSSLYAQGEDLHVAIWPGSVRNTQEITRFIAQESRSYVLSVSGLMRKEDMPAATPHLDRIQGDCPDWLADGGSCIAGPDGRWLVKPVTGSEQLVVATLDHQQVRAERQNFDPAGHYGRPDVTRLKVNRKRIATVKFED
jgi:nitrilase